MKKIFPYFLLALFLMASSVRAGEEASSTTEKSWGLQSTLFRTSKGDIEVNLPDDLRGGDMISGTVIVEPKGKNPEERARNRSELEGYVVEVEAQGQEEKGRSPAGQKKLSFHLPPKVPDNAASLVLRDANGREQARNRLDCPPLPSLPPGVSPEAIKKLLPPGMSLERLKQLLPPDVSPEIVVALLTPVSPTKSGQKTVGLMQILLPKICQAGRPCQAYGPFDGNLGTTGVDVNGEPVEAVAESPRKAVFLSPRDVTGVAEIHLVERGLEARGEFRNVGVHLSAPKTTLLKGETTTMSIHLKGLEGLQSPLSVSLRNRSTGSIRMEGGDSQSFVVSPDQVKDGTFTAIRTLTGVAPGAFSVVCKVEGGDDCEELLKEAEKQEQEAGELDEAAKLLEQNVGPKELRKYADEARKKAEKKASRAEREAKAQEGAGYKEEEKDPRKRNNQGARENLRKQAKEKKEEAKKKRQEYENCKKEKQKKKTI